MAAILNQKKALQEWDNYRQSLRKGTPIDLTETAAEKKKRIAQLEANPEEWKRYYFAKFMEFESPDFHKQATKRLIKNFLSSRHWYEVRHWVRGLSKTTTTMMDVLYLVLTGKLKNIIYVSSTYDASEAFLTKYQCQLDSNQRLINDYGKQELAGSWTMGSFTTRNGVKFLALGAGQSPRGNGNEEIRPDCIIMDDFDTDEECLNPDIINKKWRWFENALFFTVDTAKPYLILWLGNIIAEDCCVVRAGKIADYCETINIRDEFGVSVWPQKNSEADIDYQLSKVSYEAGQQEMFNNPIRQGQTFKEIIYENCPPLKSCAFALVYADPSPSNRDKPTLKSKAQNSCKAVVVLGYYNNKYYLYKCWVDNTTNNNFIDWLYAAKNYVGNATQLYTFIENNTLQNPFYEQVLMPLIHQKGKETGSMLMVTPDTQSKPEKWFRIEGTLEPLIRQGLFVFNEKEKENPHMKRMDAQFKGANANSRTLDGPDACQGGIAIIQQKIAMTASGGVMAHKRVRNQNKSY
jgi:hypothetical protein